MVEQAITDYVYGLKHNTILAKKYVIDCEAFFQSQDFQMYSNLDGKAIMNKIKEQMK